MVTPKDICFMITTAGTPCYVHLNIEMIRKFHPKATILVVNDKQSEDGIKDVSSLYEDCYYFESDSFKLMNYDNRHFQGETSIVEKGIKEAKRLGFKYVVKLSRRVIPNTEILTGLCDLINKSDALVVSNYTDTRQQTEDCLYIFGFPIRTEIMCLNVDMLYDNLDTLNRLCDCSNGQPRPFNGMMAEAWFWEITFNEVVEELLSKYATDKLKGYLNCQSSYIDSPFYAPTIVVWKGLVTPDRNGKCDQLITHWTYSNEYYYELSKQFNLPYTSTDFNLK